MYASVTLQPQTTSAKMLRLNKKSFDRFTQRNIRRNLISANHVKQMKLCKDLQHIVRAEGIQIPMFHIRRFILVFHPHNFQREVVFLSDANKLKVLTFSIGTVMD